MLRGILGGVSTADVLAEARRLVDDGRAWKARDLLLEHAETDADPELLRVLGHVLHGMGDLPRAGAIWFAAGVKGPEADDAVAAWREQSGDDFVAMWRALPEPVREEPRAPRIEALRTKALVADPKLDAPPEPLVRPGELTAPDAEKASDADEVGGVDGAQVIGWILAALFVVCAVIGIVTVLGWVVPS